jgi:multisubunit Na+/H+ antiporter MnhC subunit
VRLAPLGAGDWFLLGLGLTQSHVVVGLVIVAWFFALGLREKRAGALGNRLHNAVQIALGVLTVAALALLVVAIRHSLLGAPEMQIAGNGSSGRVLNWYQDRASDALPGALVLSVPLYVYRLAMLAWALWLAVRLIKWTKWGWRCYAAGGYWRRIERAKAKAKS